MKRVAETCCAMRGCAVLIAVLLAEPAAAQVLAQGPASRFEALFEQSREPTFVQPEVSSLFTTAEPVVRDEGAAEAAATAAVPEPVPTTTAEAEAATDAPAPLVAGAKAATKLMKELVISPAESAPAPPKQEVATGPAEPAGPGRVEEPAQAQATGSLGRTAPIPPVRTGRRLAVTRAAWYQHSGRTASGEKYNPDGLTAAHRTLPLGTRVRVVNRDNGRSVVVRINDRVPKTAKLPVDLSRASARAIGMTGVAPVALYEAE